MGVFAIKRNDRLPFFRGSLSYNDGSIPNLTGATVRFLTGAPLNINGLCDIIDPVMAIIEYPWGATDTAVAGQYRAEIEITHASGKKETFPNDGYLILQILEDLG